MEDFIKIGALNRDYFIESQNVGTDHYNTYADFLTGSKTDENLKKFKINNPMYLVPSYGSKVTIDFSTNFTRSNNGHVVHDMYNLNRASFMMTLDFAYINLRDASYLINFFEKTKAGEKFIFQPYSYDELDISDKYKSLYSIPPYFVQEFELESYGVKQSDSKTASISTTFMADKLSQLNLRNIIYIEALPQAQKEIIDDYLFREELDIQPSYEQSFAAKGVSQTFSEGKALAYSQSDSEMNFNKSMNLIYKGVSDTEALKIISFFLQKQGFETIRFKLKDPRPREVHMHCNNIEHTFVFKNSNDISVTLVECGFSMKMKSSI